MHLLLLLQKTYTNYENQGKLYLENAIYAILNCQKNDSVRQTLFNMQAKINKMSFPELQEIIKVDKVENFKGISKKIEVNVIEAVEEAIQEISDQPSQEEAKVAKQVNQMVIGSKKIKQMTKMTEQMTAEESKMPAKKWEIR